MNLLLDTCAIIFLGIDDPCISASTRRLIREAEQIYVSPISTAELACLQERGRIELPVHWKPWFRDAIETNGWDVKPITLEIMEEAYSLPGSFHSDLADRVLTATARCEDLVLLTTDRKLLDYPHLQARW
jgi:PIN domain nuclease of toxin-antitoxin system